MTPKTLSILTLALLAGCQSWKNPTTQAPPDTNTTPLANTAPEPIPPTIPDNIPNPTPRGSDTTTAAANAAQPTTPPPTTPPTTPAPGNAAAPTPAPQDNSARDQALITQDRPAVPGHGYNPIAATGPIAPATAPMPTLRDLPLPARLNVAADADVATRVRNWPLAVNTYPSGHTIAGPVYRIMPPPPRSNSTSDVVAEDVFQTLLSAPQMIITPVWMFFDNPLTPVEYHGEQFPPSYTVNDPLPYYVNEKVPGIIQMTREKQP